MFVDNVNKMRGCWYTCLYLQTREEAKGLLRTIQARRGQDTAGSTSEMNIDDSMDSIAPTDQFNLGLARTFDRVTPVNLKFTP